MLKLWIHFFKFFWFGDGPKTRVVIKQETTLPWASYKTDSKPLRT